MMTYLAGENPLYFFTARKYWICSIVITITPCIQYMEYIISWYYVFYINLIKGYTIKTIQTNKFVKMVQKIIDKLLNR